MYSLLATDFLADLNPEDDQLIPSATKAGCPIQAVLWLEWDPQH